MAEEKKRSRTPEQVEDCKSRENFDRNLALALMPKRHPGRLLLETPQLSETTVQAIRDHIDGHFGRFLARGGKRIPKAIYQQKPVRASRSYTAGPDLDKLLRRFIEVCYRELHGEEPEKSEVRRLANQSAVLIVELVRRTKALVPIVTY
jgi:hypothetical protein